MTRTTLRASCAALAILPAFAFAQEDGAEVIVVTGSPLDRTQDDLLAGASVLDGEDLVRQSSNTIGETLRQEPGLSETQFGAGASRPIIRGLGGDRVRILTNGIGSIDASSASPDHAVPVEPATAERIEVVRGTGLLRYGSSAAGGVVNVIDGRIPRAAPEGGGTGAFRVQGASVDESVEAAGALTTTAAEFGGVSLVLHGSGTVRDAQDYEIPVPAESEVLAASEGEVLDDEGGGELENSFAQTKSGALGASLIGERGFLGVSVKRTDTTYGIPAGHAHAHEEGEEHDEEEGAEHSEGEEEEGVFIDLEQTRVDLNGRYEFADGPLEAVALFAGFADYEHVEFEGPGEPGTVFANEGYEVRLEAIQRTRGALRGAFGVQLREREFSAIGEEAFVPPTETTQVGAYTFQELRSGPWHGEAAVRIENTDHERSTDGLSRDFTGFSASVGVGYDVTENLDVALTVLRTERAPTTEELYSDGPHLATDQYELGDIELGIETALGAEALFHAHSDRASATLNLFYTDYDDFVYERDTGTFGDTLLLARGEDDLEELEEFGELPVYQFTAADARFYGFELFGEAEIAEVSGVSLTVDGVLDYVETEIEDTGEDLPRIPPLGLTAGVEAARERHSLRVEVEHAEDTEGGERELPTDGYTLLNLYGAVQLTERLTLRGAVLNATDAEARLATSFLKDEVPLPGRNFRVSLGYAF